MNLLLPDGVHPLYTPSCSRVNRGIKSLAFVPAQITATTKNKISLFALKYCSDRIGHFCAEIFHRYRIFDSSVSPKGNCAITCNDDLRWFGDWLGSLLGAVRAGWEKQQKEGERRYYRPLHIIPFRSGSLLVFKKIFGSVKSSYFDIF